MTKIVNINVGILGHVDSGKTTISKALSDVSSTAAFDKDPQSQERGITLDLGFSAMVVDIPDHLRSQTTAEQLQFTFVDCPGHAKLIKTIIGGTNIIDLMLLVIDVQKGIQAQTTECLVLGEITCKTLIVALNKIDLLDPKTAELKIDKFTRKFGAYLKSWAFASVQFVSLSATIKTNIHTLKRMLVDSAFVPTRNNNNSEFLFAADHCFTIKGHGAICTGTVLQGQIHVNDVIEIPQLNETKKIKSIQSFKRSLSSAAQGDRIGICITQFNTELIERGTLASPGFVRQIKAAVVKINRIRLQKNIIKSKSKLLIISGYETSTARITLFTTPAEHNGLEFNWTDEYEYLEELANDEEFDECKSVLVYFEFDNPMFIAPNQLFLALIPNTEQQTQQCRLMFWGHLITIIERNDTDLMKTLNHLKLFKRKVKTGHILRFIGKHEAISKDMFQSDSERRFFIGQPVSLSTGECGVVSSPFGNTSKVRIQFANEVADATLELHSKNSNGIEITLNYKKFVNKIR